MLTCHAFDRPGHRQQLLRNSRPKQVCPLYHKAEVALDSVFVLCLFILCGFKLVTSHCTRVNIGFCLRMRQEKLFECDKHLHGFSIKKKKTSPWIQNVADPQRNDRIGNVLSWPNCIFVAIRNAIAALELFFHAATKTRF